MKNEWIDIKQQKPKEKGHYLCVKAGYLPFCACWRTSYGDNELKFYHDGDPAWVTHWRTLDSLDLPEPPLNP